MELIDGVSLSCIRFSQNMAGLKMFILCVMRRNKVVVCFLPIWDISWKLGRGWWWNHGGEGLVSVLQFHNCSWRKYELVGVWVVLFLTVPFNVWRHHNFLFFGYFFLCLCVFVFDLWWQYRIDNIFPYFGWRMWFC